MKIGILGYGEIGRAIGQLYFLNADYYDIAAKDLSRDDGLEGIEVLNVCIPYSDEFASVVIGIVIAFMPKLTIIHSTVKPGTTEIISQSVREVLNEKHFVVHSPIRGKHPNLYDSLFAFTKYIGADDTRAAPAATSHLEGLGLTVECVGSSKTTELGKLLSTAYYGLCIAWHGEMAEICKRFGVDFEAAVTAFNKSYNEGYEEMGHPEFIRPVLTPPENGISGHCVISNAEMLKSMLPDRQYRDDGEGAFSIYQTIEGDFTTRNAFDLILKYASNKMEVENV